MDFLRSHYGYYFTPEDAKRLKEYVERFNKSCWDYRTFESFRIYCNKAGFWNFKSEEEQVCELIEQTNISSFEAKQQILHRMKR